MADLTIEVWFVDSKYALGCDIEAALFITIITRIPVVGIVALGALPIVMFTRTVVSMAGFTVCLPFMGEFSTSPRVRAVAG